MFGNTTALRIGQWLLMAQSSILSQGKQQSYTRFEANGKGHFLPSPLQVRHVTGPPVSIPFADTTGIGLSSDPWSCDRAASGKFQAPRLGVTPAHLGRLRSPL